MSLDDQVRWDKAYRERKAGSQEPSPFLVAMEGMLPIRGRALDIAGGAGANAVWLARRGLEVTVADISPVGLALAERNAEFEGLRLRTLKIDLEQDPFPPGPWDLIVCVRFLWRPLFAVIPDELAGRRSGRRSPHEVKPVAARTAGFAPPAGGRRTAGPGARPGCRALRGGLDRRGASRSEAVREAFRICGIEPMSTQETAESTPQR